MPQTISLVKGLAVGSSLWTGGAMSALSLFTVPVLLSAPHNIAAKQFKLLHAIGSSTYPPAILAITLLHALAAYQVHARLHSGGGPPALWVRWAASAALTVAALPWTAAFMLPVNRRLLAIAGTSDKREGGTEISDKTEGLLRKWSALNAARAGLTFSAGLLGLWTVLEGY